MNDSMNILNSGHSDKSYAEDFCNCLAIAMGLAIGAITPKLRMLKVSQFQRERYNSKNALV